MLCFGILFELYDMFISFHSFTNILLMRVKTAIVIIDTLIRDLGTIIQKLSLESCSQAFLELIDVAAKRIYFSNNC